MTNKVPDNVYQARMQQFRPKLHLVLIPALAVLTACAPSAQVMGTSQVMGSSSTAVAGTNATGASTNPSPAGSGGSASQSVTVTTTAPTIALSASPTSISTGASSTLSWSVSNATSCTASGAWSGAMAMSGTKSTGSLSSSATYNLSCTGSGGTTQQSTTVAVNAAQSAPVTTSAAASCTGSSGPLTLKASITRASGVSPLLAFFDATGTTDSSIKANTTAFQEVHYSWNFGDTGASGTGSTWAYGSNPGRNSKNTAGGGVAAHLYITPGTDKAYTATVTATDGTNTASCQLGVTAYDPAGANGFAGANTTCVSASGTPAAGTSGCPSGAAVLSTSSIATALGSSHLANGKRVLFKCGDTFTGHDVIIGGVTKWSVGAYGGCEGTQTNRPIFSFSGASDGNGILQLGSGTSVPGDGRLADFDCEGNHNASRWCAEVISTNNIPYQITMYNLYSNGNQSNYSWAQGAQMGLIGSVATGMLNAIGNFINYSGNGTGIWKGNVINNVNYQALLGNSLSGAGDTGTEGDENVRIGACMYCVLSNNVMENGNSVGAVLKVFESNNAGSGGSQTNFAGIPVQYVEISDNLFTGKSGAQLVEVSPQNNCSDERFYDVVLERNLFQEVNDGLGTFLLLSGENETVRDNVFYVGAGFLHPSFYHVQIAERAGTSGCSPNPVAVQTTQYTEVYNNTGYALSFRFPQYLIGFSTNSMSGNAGSNSWVQNNLYYNSVGAAIVVSDSGTGNSIANNSVNVGANPGFINASGSFSTLSDFQPTANYTGGVPVPVLLDALNQPWPPTWDLGAAHH